MGMGRQEFDEFLDSTAIIPGVGEKRVRDCTPDELDAALAGLREKLQDKQAELDWLRGLAEKLKGHPPGTTVEDLGF